MTAGVFILDQCFLSMISHQGERVWFVPLWPKEHLKILCKAVPLILRVWVAFLFRKQKT